MTVMWQKALKTSRDSEDGGPASADQDYLLPKENKSCHRRQPTLRRQSTKPWKSTCYQRSGLKCQKTPQYSPAWVRPFCVTTTFWAAYIILSFLASTPMFPSYLMVFPPSQRKTGNIWCHQVKEVPESKEDINFHQVKYKEKEAKLVFSAF